MEVTMFPIASVFGEAVSDTALSLEDLGFTEDEVTAAAVAHITVEGQAIRYRYDGSAPTDTLGHPLAVGADIIIRGQRLLTNLQVVRQSSDAVINVTLLKWSPD